MLEAIVAFGFVLLVMFLIDRRNEAIERMYSSHWLYYEELHSIGRVTHIIIDDQIHYRYRIHTYSVGISLKLNFERASEGLWVEVENGAIYKISVNKHQTEDKWVIDGLGASNSPPCNDNTVRTRIPKYKQNKAP